MAYVPGFSPYLQNSIRPTPGVETMGGDPSYVPGFSPYLQSVQPSAPPIMEQPPQPDGMSFSTAQDVIGGGWTGDNFDSASRLANYDPSSVYQGFIAPSATRGNKWMRPSETPSLDFVDYDGQQGFFFTTNTGRAATTKANKTGFVPVNPNATYRLIDERGKVPVVEGVGADGLKNVYQTAQVLSAQGGKKADWKLQQLDPATGKWTVVADDDPKANVLGAIADIALPVAASFIPGIGPVLGAALGSVGSSVLQGRSLKDTLLRAGLTAGTAGLLDATGASSALGGALGSAAGGGAGGALAGATAGAGIAGSAGAALAGLGNQIIVNGVLPSALGSAISSGIGAGVGSLAGGALSGGNGITVTGQRPTPPGPVSGVVDAALGGASGGIIGNPIEVTAPRPGQQQDPVAPPPNLIDSRPVTEEGYIEVVDNRPNPNDNGNLPIGALLPAAPLVTAPIAPVQTPDLSPEIVVERDRPTSFDTPVPPLPLVNAPVTPVQTPNVQAPPKNGLDVVEILRAAGLLSGLVGGAFEGGGAGLGRIPAGLGGLPTDTSGLPAPNIPGLGGAGVQQRPQGNKTTQDWYRYGYGPEQSFFNYVPETAPNTSTAFTGYAEGGEVSPFAVNGPGTGRSDDIPALLSDGEYVIDAETVALLGDGSTKAGAERLDQFRVNVRKHKGKQLAKGGFSVDAKRPEAYMTGGAAR